jgi:hypothetical protein
MDVQLASGSFSLFLPVVPSQLTQGSSLHLLTPRLQPGCYPHPWALALPPSGRVPVLCLFDRYTRLFLLTALFLFTFPSKVFLFLGQLL